MKNVPIKLGPLALLLAVVSICLTTLAILTYSTARADRRLAEKFAQTVTTRYALEAQGQELLGRLGDPAAGGIPGDWERGDDGLYWTTIEQDGARLRIALAEREGGGYDVAAWLQDRQWTQDTHIENLWTGN